MSTFEDSAETQARQKALAANGLGQRQPSSDAGRPTERGRTAIWQARLVLLVMINITQLWILSATIEAALAGEYRHLVPLIISSVVCWVIALTIFLWWKPASSRRTISGYLRRLPETADREF